MRISLFGGSTDYKSFYEQHGSFIIGTTIDKYVYSIVRYRPSIVGNDYMVTYSTIEKTNVVDEIKNPLIRETLKYYKVLKPIELNLASDIPSRTGLGGSSSCCVSLANSICVLKGIPANRNKICLDAIKIEREILKESGGIQDQIWACYGGFNNITIQRNGKFTVKSMPVSDDFKNEFESSLMLIYSKKQRVLNRVPQSHNNEDKKKILQISKCALDEFVNGNIKSIGNLLYDSWKEKRALSPFISDQRIDYMIDDIINQGAYGAKLLGSGAGGFILVVCNKNTKRKLTTKYRDAIVDFKFESNGLIDSRI
jgi:D-glycero-alpha-D-manno-heptose-7-phosphate kinase